MTCANVELAGGKVMVRARFLGLLGLSEDSVGDISDDHFVSIPWHSPLYLLTNLLVAPYWFHRDLNRESFTMDMW